MSATRISDLLPIPPGENQPHPYQVFGLEDGEQDQAKIHQAIEAVFARLNASKSATDANLWLKAANLASDARAILNDPAAKSQLDARFGIISFSNFDEDSGDSSQPVQNNQSAVDPLAGVLPSSDPLAQPPTAGDPLAGMLPSSDPLASADSAGPASEATDPSGSAAASPAATAPEFSVRETTGVSNSITQPIDAPHPPADSVAQPPAGSGAPIVVAPKRVVRRKRSSGGLAMAMLGLGMITVIGLLSYFLFFGGGTVAVTNTEGEFTVATQPTDPRQTSTAFPMDGRSDHSGTDQQASVDDRPRDAAEDLMPPEDAGPTDWGDQDEPQFSFDPVDPAPEDPAMPPIETDPQPSEMADSPAGQPDEPMDEAAETSSDNEMPASATPSLDDVRNLIRTADWGAMRAAAEQAQQQTMTPPEQEQANALHDIADLATYYRRAIERAVIRLQADSEIEITEAVRIVVIGSNENQLTFRLNNQQKSMTVDEMPFSLIGKLARMELPESPRLRAAELVYQAIAPRSNEEYRQHAVESLGQLEELDDLDPGLIADILEAIVSGESSDAGT